MKSRHPGRYPKPGETRPAPLIRVTWWVSPEARDAFLALHLPGETHGEAFERIVNGAKE